MKQFGTKLNSLDRILQASKQARKLEKSMMSSSILLQPLWMETLGLFGLVTPTCWQHAALPVQSVVIA